MRWILRLRLTLCLAAQTALGVLHIKEPLIVTKYGTLRGKQEHVAKTPIHVFLGVPFSKPPVGSRRFAPPETLEPWKGIRDATTHPPACLQESWGQVTSMYLNTGKQYTWLRFSEDCLYLNVYAPVRARGDPLRPVMVWFPGGALLVGSASTYDGSELAAREKVVLVILQHRLGILGFLSTGDSQARGNWGLLDQVAALRWVQENIKAFGGDPDSVALFGQSAGAMCVSGLVFLDPIKLTTKINHHRWTVKMMSPLAQGLFHRAISQSGTAISKVFITHDPLKVAKKVAHLAGCNHSNTRIMVDCLRALSGAQVMRVSKRMGFFHVNLQKEPQEITWLLSPVVDGVVFPDDPEVLLSRGQVSPVPYLLGVTNAEFKWVLPSAMKFPLNPRIMRKDALTRLLWTGSTLLNATKEQIALALEEYLGDTDKHDWKTFRNNLTELFGDAIFVYPMLQTARYHRDAGFPVYLYEFERHAPSGIFVKPRIDGADHGDENYFIFGTLFSKVLSTGEEKALSIQMMKYWTNFARTGNPNDGKLPCWPRYDKDEKYLQLDFTTRVGVKLKEKKMDFWRRLYQPHRPEKQKQF